MTAPPLRFRFDGKAMLPLNPASARRYYQPGECYRLAPHEERSGNSHRHYFSCIADAHANLPEHMAERWPTPDHLRRWLLIRAGYYDERSIVVGSKAEAQRVAAFVKPLDAYAVVIAKEAVVSVFTAKSQSYKAMGKAEFQRSKEAVLDALAAMIGVERETLAKEAGRAA